MALALIRGSMDGVAIVTDGSSAYGVDLTTRTLRWHTTDLPTNGKVIFTRGTLWGIPSDIAIGPGRTLYVTEPVAPYRAGPRL